MKGFRQIGIIISDKLYKKIKIQALNDGITVSEAVRFFLDLYVSKKIEVKK